MSAGTGKATAVAHPNIAFVKYWGNTDPALNLPTNPSVSMNLDSLHTATTTAFLAGPEDDEVIIDDSPTSGTALQRVSEHLNRVRGVFQSQGSN